MGGKVLHGVFTVKTPSGTYQTVEEQVGTVTAVSSGSITVKSTDGYSNTYSVSSSTVVDSQAGGINAVAANDTVRVSAAVPKSGTDTATSITDTTKIAASRSGFGFGAPTAAPTGTASGTAADRKSVV